MNTTDIKESRLNIRCGHRARALLDKAAAYAQTSVSESVLSHDLVSAGQVAQAHEAITLTPVDFQLHAFAWKVWTFVLACVIFGRLNTRVSLANQAILKK